MDPDTRRNVEINVGKACNNRCVFCVDGEPGARERAWMSLDHMKAELRHHADQGFESVGFLGGEPTTWRHLVEAVAFAREQGFSRIAVATNATRLRKPAFTDALVAAGLTRVTVSMHGHTAALEDHLTGVPGNFDKKRAALDLLVAHRRAGRLADGLSVNVVLCGPNHRHLGRMLRFFFEEVGVDDVRANFVRPEGRAQGDRALVPRYADVVPSVIRALVLNERHFRRTFTFGGFPLCVLPAPLRRDPQLLRRTMGEYRDLVTACSVRSEGGDMVPPQARDEWARRSSAVDYDEAAGRARFDWRRRKREDLKVRPERCASCVVELGCEGVWREWLDLWGPQDLSPLGPGDVAWPWQ